MTEPIPFKPADPTERKEWADEAKELVANKAFSEAILRLRKQWFAEAMAAPPGPVRDEIIAKVKALEAIPQQLQILVNDQIMATARSK